MSEQDEVKPDLPTKGGILSAIIRGMLIYLGMNAFKQFHAPTQTTTHSVKALKSVGASSNQIIRPRCIWNINSLMDLHVFISDSKTIDCDVILGEDNKTGVLVEWHENDLVLGSFDKAINQRHMNITIPFPPSVQWNETHLFAQMCMVLKDNPSEKVSETQSNIVMQKTFQLTKHRKRKRIRDEKNLLDGNMNHDMSPKSNSSLHDIQSSPLTLASANKSIDVTLLYLKPSLTLQLIDLNGMPQFSVKEAIPQSIKKHMDWIGKDSHLFYPILHSSEFWIMSDDLIEVNDTISESIVMFHFEEIKMWKWQLLFQMEESWRKQEEMGEDSGSDFLRNMIINTNPILLGVTAIISVLHTVFDILAFSNDIKFFKKKKSMEGLSLHSMIVNTFFQIVILLYLFDNDTSYMVLLSNAIGVAIEIWKISKAMTISLFDATGKFALSFKETDTYKDSKTKIYDEIATGHLMFVSVPLIFGYALYSLVHRKHKSWYSWILSSLTGAIYMFGFINMTPQLFINYKLKSVAHLNWKTMTYKSINTFIDDLFAFVIKMPIMHRLACLRDDVIFFIFLYQRCIYKTDYTRVNEFGQCDQSTEDTRSDFSDDVGFDGSKDSNTNELQLPRRRGAKDKR